MYNNIALLCFCCTEQSSKMVALSSHLLALLNELEIKLCWLRQSMFVVMGKESSVLEEVCVMCLSRLALWRFPPLNYTREPSKDVAVFCRYQVIDRQAAAVESYRWSLF